MKYINIYKICFGFVLTGFITLSTFLMSEIFFDVKELNINMAVVQSKMNTVIEYKYELNELGKLASNNDKRIAIIENSE